MRSFFRKDGWALKKNANVERLVFDFERVLVTTMDSLSSVTDVVHNR